MLFQTRQTCMKQALEIINLVKRMNFRWAADAPFHPRIQEAPQSDSRGLNSGTRHEAGRCRKLHNQNMSLKRSERKTGTKPGLAPRNEDLHYEAPEGNAPPAAGGVGEVSRMQKPVIRIFGVCEHELSRNR